jgi:hypothetical protein
MVMVLGVDVHKDTHTTVAVDQAGQRYARCGRLMPGMSSWWRGHGGSSRASVSGPSRTAATCRLVWNEHCSGPERRWYGYRRS